MLAARLRDTGSIAAGYAVRGEPELAMVEQGAALARAAACDSVVAIGGGSVLDAAKAIAALAANPGGALEYMEVVGAGRSLELPALPVLAVPTTAGTGSEVTRNAVIRAPAARAKASIRDASLLPKIALVDATLTYDLPAHVTASGGMDAITQLIEAFVSRRANVLTDGLCLQGLSQTRWALVRAYEQPRDAEARAAMSEASLLSGVALANAGLGAVHGIAAPFGGAYPAPHGAACAALLPGVTAANIRALRMRDPNGPALGRYAQVAAVLGAGATPDDLIGFVRDLALKLQIPGLATYGLRAEDVPQLAAQAAQASSTRSNPVALELEELVQVIEEAL